MVVLFIYFLFFGQSVTFLCPFIGLLHAVHVGLLLVDFTGLVDVTTTGTVNKNIFNYLT
jgi:hypothetical protein